MSVFPSRPADTYSPLYFLTSLGTGGLVITFFMWLMHWTKHPGHPVPVFEDITASFVAGGSAGRSMIILALAGIGLYAFLNLKYLVWNLVQFKRFQRTPAYEKMASSNAETQVLAMPLAMAMSVNVFFILGMVFVPGLWSVVEYLFPVAILVFLAIGVVAFRMLGKFMGRVMTAGGFSCASNNSFAQALPAFALAMIGVGLAAPAGLSASPLVAGTGLVLSTFFLVAAVLIAAIALVLGLRSLAENGANIETAPTLSVFIPVLTIVSILSLRQNHGLDAHFALASGGAERLMMLSQYLSAQILFALLTGLVLRRLGYFSRFITGREASPVSYALVCPGVALVVMIHFWLNRGLVDSGMIDKFSLGYWTITALALAIQFATAWLVFVLNRKHFKGA
ncbi:MAG: TsoY family (seleno)protein [Thermodesulfobacteriota bacterium]